MKLRFLNCLLFASIVLAGISRVQADQPAHEPLTIGVMVSLSGNWAAIGEMTRKGLILAAEDLNSRGGILGRLVNFEFQDTDEAVSAAKVISAYRFLRSKNIEILIGPTGSPGGIALAPIASRDKVLVITPSVGVRDFHSTGDNLFNAQGVWEASSAMLARYVRSQRIERIAIFSSQHPFEVRQADAFESAFREAGGEVVIRREPNPEITDLRSDALRIVQSGVPAAFYANYNQMGIAAKQLSQAGFKGLQFATQIDASRLVPADRALNGTIFTRLTDDPTDKFDSDFRKRFNEAPSYTADFAYDALLAIAHAAQRAGSLEIQPLKSAMSQVSFKGASGDFAFDLEGCVIRRPTVWKVEEEKFLFVSALERKDNN